MKFGNPFRRKGKVAPAPATPTGAGNVTPAKPTDPGPWQPRPYRGLRDAVVIPRLLWLYHAGRNGLFKNREGKVNKELLHNWMRRHDGGQCSVSDLADMAALCIY